MYLAEAPNQSKEHVWWKQYRKWEHLQRFPWHSRQIPPLQCWADFFFFYCLQVRNDAFNSLSHSKISSSPSTLEIAAAQPKAFTFSWCQFQQQSQHVAFPATAWVKTVVLRSSCRKLGSSSPVWWTGPSGSWLGTNILLGSQGKIWDTASEEEEE